MVLVLRERGETDRAAALVNVMQDQPENSAFVAAMRKELNIRRATRLLLERPAVQRQLFAPPAPSLRTRAGRATSVFVFLAILGVGSWISYDRNEPWLLATTAGAAAIGAWVSGLFFR
jgi:hypothetical protein